MSIYRYAKTLVLLKFNKNRREIFNNFTNSALLFSVFFGTKIVYIYQCIFSSSVTAEVTQTKTTRYRLTHRERVRFLFTYSMIR